MEEEGRKGYVYEMTEEKETYICIMKNLLNVLVSNIPKNRFWGNSFRVTIALLEKYLLLNENYDVYFKFSDNDC